MSRISRFVFCSVSRFLSLLLCLALLLALNACVISSHRVRPEGARSETESETSPDTVPEPESDTVPADTGSPDGSLPDVTDGEETTAKEKGCRSTLSAWISLLVTGAALLLSKKREIFSRT